MNLATTIIFGIIKADYLQRTRSYNFLITLLVSVYVAYAFFPLPTDSYTTVRVGTFVGESNAAWIGHVTAIMTSTFLWFIGFYLINNGIKRDIDTGVGQIIATTSISNFRYLLAKAASNFLVLCTISLIILGMALLLTLVRGSNYSFDLVQFLFPYIFTVLPSLFFLGVWAVFFEVIFGKNTILLNLAFFFFFITILANVGMNQHESIIWFDFLGTKYLMNSIAEVINAKYNNNADMGNMLNNTSVGFQFYTKMKIQRVLFEGTTWKASYFISRFIWLGIAFIVLFIASKIFNRFDQKVLFKTKQKNKKEVIIENIATSPQEFSLANLPKISLDFSIFPLIKTEFLLLIRKGYTWFWLINAGVFMSMFFTPLQETYQIALPVFWFLQVNRWADIATKENFYGTNYFIYAAYKPLQRLLSAQIIAGFALASFLALPIVVRYVMLGDFLSVFHIFLGALFVVVSAIFLGLISGGKRLYEMLFFVLTYGITQKIPFFDYFGAFHQQDSHYFLWLVGILLGMLAVAFAVRKYEISHQ